MAASTEAANDAQPSSSATEPVLGRGILQGFKFDISHQEMDRIVDELDQTYTFSFQEWLDVGAIGEMLTQHLGYEDLDEFEDALKGSWPDFLSALPIVEVREKAEGSGKEFRVKGDHEFDSRPTTLTCSIASREDLWRVVLKSAKASIRIPEVDFEVGSDNKRHIDSIYNLLGDAVFNLEKYVSALERQDASNEHALNSDDIEKVTATLASLRQLMDLERPFTFKVIDPSGRSEMQPMTGVDVEFGETQPPAPASAPHADGLPTVAE